MIYQTIRVNIKNKICTIQIYRPEAKNTINDLLIEEFAHALNACDEDICIVIIEGLPEIFCFGADFNGIEKEHKSTHQNVAEQLYNLWLKLTYGPYITIAHVKGKANAGGVGFVAACDIVIADETAQFSLSELLFGLMPACVLPFLIRRIGVQKANYMTLMTQVIAVNQAHQWGLVDLTEKNSDVLLQRQLLRLKCLAKTGIKRYKSYLCDLDESLTKNKELAINAYREVFSDTQNISNIKRYIDSGLLPWETEGENL